MTRRSPHDIYNRLPLTELRNIARSASALVDGCRVTVDPDTGYIRFSRKQRQPGPALVRSEAPEIDALARAILNRRKTNAADTED
jgi:hypothetical protein